MAVLKMFQASVGLLFLGHVLLGHASWGLESCTAILPSDTIAKLGDRTVIKCRLTSQNILWTFCSRGAGPYAIANNCNLVSSALGSYRLDKTSDACNLVIDNVTASHLGRYTCQDLTLDDHGYTVELGNRDENFAIHKPTIQSSTYANWVSNLAVDGNSDSNGGHLSCTATLSVAPNWWAVDLGQETPIGRVRITNRADALPERLQRFFIGLTNISPFIQAPNLTQSSICTYYSGMPAAGIAIDIYCDPNTKAGRFLFVYMPQTECLTLCELEAYYK